MLIHVILLSLTSINTFISQLELQESRFMKKVEIFGDYQATLTCRRKILLKNNLWVKIFGIFNKLILLYQFLLFKLPKSPRDEYFMII